MSVEASFILSMVVMLFYLIIICSLLIFMRCYKSEVDYIQKLKTERYTEYYGDTPMVIYDKSDSFNPIK